MTTKTAPTIACVNLYRWGAEWCYAALTLDPTTHTLQHDHSDTLGIADEASEADATAEVSVQFPGATIERVSDL